MKENGEMPDQYTEITVRGDGQKEDPHDTGSAEDRRKVGPSVAIMQRRSRIRQGSSLR